MLSLILQNHFFWPLDGSAREAFQKMWVKSTSESGAQIISETIPVMFGRYSCQLSHDIFLVSLANILLYLLFMSGL